MGKGLSFFVCLLFMLSCNDAGNTSVYDLDIPRDTLRNILWYLTVAEAATINYRGDKRDSMKNVFRYNIEQIYGYKMTYINSTLNQLYQRPLLNKELQKEVIDSLKVLEELTKRAKK